MSEQKSSNPQAEQILEALDKVTLEIRDDAEDEFYCGATSRSALMLAVVERVRSAIGVGQLW